MVKMSLVKIIMDKLDSYGIEIYSHQHDNECDIIFATDMIIFLDNIKNDTVVSFQATMRPDDAARYILVLKQIPDIHLVIMEAFIYNKEKRFIIGEDAYRLIKESIKYKAKVEYATEEAYTQILEQAECFKC